MLNHSLIFLNCNMKVFSNKTVNNIFKIIAIYIFWVGTHYSINYLYQLYCVPTTYLGILMSPFIMHSPHCQAFNWLFNLSFKSINYMISSLVGIVAAKLLSMEKPF